VVAPLGAVIVVGHLLPRGADVGVSLTHPVYFVWRTTNEIYRAVSE
jgi:hypothetical protein